MAGKGVPSNKVRLIDGKPTYIGGFTQNKPRSVVEPCPKAATFRLWDGEDVMVDVRYMETVREMLAIIEEDLGPRKEDDG